MGLMSGKKGVVVGVANDHSLAWYIAEMLHKEGAEIAFNYLPGEKMERRVRKLAEPIGAKIISPAMSARTKTSSDSSAKCGRPTTRSTFSCMRWRSPIATA